MLPGPQTNVQNRVADPHYFDADSDPDPIFHMDTDPDSTFHTDVDMDPDPFLFFSTFLFPTFQVDADPYPDLTTHFFQIWTLQCSKMTL